MAWNWSSWFSRIPCSDTTPVVQVTRPLFAPGRPILPPAPVVVEESTALLDGDRMKVDDDDATLRPSSPVPEADAAPPSSEPDDEGRHSAPPPPSSPRMAGPSLGELRTDPF